MSTRSSKSMKAIDETTESVIDKIILFMSKDETKAVGLAEIVRSIDSNYSKFGISKILKQLEEEGKIKNTVDKPKDPRYLTVDVEKYTAKFEAYAYKDFTSFGITQEGVEKSELSKIKYYNNSSKEEKTKNDISKWIFQFGLISLQTILASYRKHKDPELQKVWLRNAMSFENNLNSSKFSEQVKKQLIHNVQDDKEDRNPLGFTTKDDRIRKTDKQFQASEIESVLAKMFPKLMKEFQRVEDDLNSEETYKLMKDVCKSNPEYLLE
jgi:hypothetical protein